MKKQIFLIMLLAFFSVSFTSCYKEYECKCPAGTTGKVKTARGKPEAKAACEAQSGGVCTL